MITTGDALDTAAGQQGSPVWRTKRVRGRKKHQLVALVSGYSETLDATGARRVLPDVKFHSKSWRRGRTAKVPTGENNLRVWSFAEFDILVTQVSSFGGESVFTAPPAGKVTLHDFPRGVLQRFAFYRLNSQGERADQPIKIASVFITEKYGPDLRVRSAK